MLLHVVLYIITYQNSRTAREMNLPTTVIFDEKLWLSERIAIYGSIPLCTYAFVSRSVDDFLGPIVGWGIILMMVTLITAACLPAWRSKPYLVGPNAVPRNRVDLVVFVVVESMVCFAAWIGILPLVHV
jgi:hypothetical protein